MSTCNGRTDTCQRLRQPQLIDVRMFEKIDDHARATWYRYLFNLWMMLRLNAVGAIFATLIGVVIVWKSDIDAP